MAWSIPKGLAASCRRTRDRAEWLSHLPRVLDDLERRWAMTLAAPFDSEDVSCAWVAPARLADGTSAIFKLGMPHMEAEQELEGLKFWNGDPTERVLLSDDDSGAMLLERCLPGTSLRALPEPEQDVVIAALLRRMWRVPESVLGFRPLAVLTDYWSQETLASREQWRERIDAGLVQEGLRLFQELPRTAPRQALLATDLHAGNVLRAEREPWLAIDPKPFVGDPAFDATQHLFNGCRLRQDALGAIRRMADLLQVDSERVKLWVFARAAAEPREDWKNEERFAIARALAP